MSTYITETDFAEMCLAEEEEYVILNSCALSRMFIIRDQSCLKSFA